MKHMNAVKKYGARVVAVGTVAVSGAAMAAPDIAGITAAIEGVGTSVDAVGGSMTTLFVGLLVFSVIIGMILRKGK